MKKLLLVILSVLTLCSLTLGLTACGGDQGDVKSFTLYTEINVEKYDSFEALKTIDGTASYIKWKTSDKKICTVEDGLVQAVGVGEATITATAGDLKAEAKVVVTATNKVPTVTLDKEDVSLKVGDAIVVNGYVTFKNKAKLGEYTYSSNDESIATVDENGKITGVKIGETTVNVVAKFADYTTVKKVNVKVIKDAVVKLNAYNVDLKLNASVDAGKDTFTIVPSAFVGGESVKGGSYAFASSNPEVATVDINGVIRGVGVGSADVTVSATVDGTNFVETVKVTTSKSVVNIAMESFEAYKSVNGNVRTPNDIAIPVGTYGLTDSELSNAKATYALGGVTGTFSNSNVAYSGDKSVCNLSGRQFGSEIYGENAVVTFDTDTTVINVNIGTLVTKFISTKTDFENIIAYGNGNSQIDGIPYNGYFVMTNNIDLNGTIARREPNVDFKVGTKVTNNADLTSGFKGIFDGKGYSLYNYRHTTDKGGLFGNLSKFGVIQNLGIADAIYDVKVAGDIRTGIFGNDISGTINNCYVEMTVAENTHTFDPKSPQAWPIIARELSVATISDVVIKADLTNRGQVGFVAGGYKLQPWPNYWELKVNFAGLYVFSTEEMPYGSYGAKKADGSYYASVNYAFSFGYEESYIAPVKDYTYWAVGTNQPIFISAQG